MDYWCCAPVHGMFAGLNVVKRDVFVLQSCVRSTQHPNKANKTNFHGREIKNADAFFISPLGVGIADGVSAVEYEGVDSSLLSQELMTHCRELVHKRNIDRKWWVSEKKRMLQDIYKSIPKEDSWFSQAWSTLIGRKMASAEARDNRIACLGDLGLLEFITDGDRCRYALSDFIMSSVREWQLASEATLLQKLALMPAEHAIIVELMEKAQDDQHGNDTTTTTTSSKSTNHHGNAHDNTHKDESKTDSSRLTLIEYYEAKKKRTTGISPSVMFPQPITNGPSPTQSSRTSGLASGPPSTMRSRNSVGNSNSAKGGSANGSRRNSYQERERKSISGRVRSSGLFHPPGTVVADRSGHYDISEDSPSDEVPSGASERVQLVERAERILQDAQIALAMLSKSDGGFQHFPKAIPTEEMRHFLISLVVLLDQFYDSTYSRILSKYDCRTPLDDDIDNTPKSRYAIEGQVEDFSHFNEIGHTGEGSESGLRNWNDPSNPLNMSTQTVWSVGGPDNSVCNYSPLKVEPEVVPHEFVLPSHNKKAVDEMFIVDDTEEEELCNFALFGSAGKGLSRNHKRHPLQGDGAAGESPHFSHPTTIVSSEGQVAHHTTNFSSSANSPESPSGRRNSSGANSSPSEFKGTSSGSGSSKGNSHVSGDPNGDNRVSYEFTWEVNNIDPCYNGTPGATSDDPFLQSISNLNRRISQCVNLKAREQVLTSFFKCYGDSRLLLQNAFTQCQELGSTTALVCLLEKNILLPCNMGDSAYFLFRKLPIAADDPSTSPLATDDERSTASDDKVGTLGTTCDPVRVGSKGHVKSIHQPKMRYQLMSRSSSQLHSFNCPYQLTRMPDVDFGSLDSLWAQMRRIDSVNPIIVEEGDVLIVGTDGLFDNVFEDRIADIVNDVMMNDISVETNSSVTILSSRNDPSVGSETMPLADGSVVIHGEQIPKTNYTSNNRSRQTPEKVLCETLLREALENAYPNGQETPFSQSCSKRLGKHVVGGKPDDTTVIVSIVAANTEVTEDLWFSEFSNGACQ